jgi:hypothetical protein
LNDEEWFGAIHTTSEYARTFNTFLEWTKENGGSFGWFLGVLAPLGMA